jgi:hypothetical protein
MCVSSLQIPDPLERCYRLDRNEVSSIHASFHFQTNVANQVSWFYDRLDM